MIDFILNDTLVATECPPGMPLLDFIRNEMGLKGTKTGCREGDCGACLVLCGGMENSHVQYKTIVSCLTPLGNIKNSHIVTIEGLNGGQLSPIQQSFLSNSATQCGFCTPGFILSLTGFLISGDFSDPDQIISSIDGNICRCTGYSSIIRAARQVFQQIPPEGRNNREWLVSHHYLPRYFLSIPGKMSGFTETVLADSGNKTIVAGGTDLMVQKADSLFDTEPEFVNDRPGMKSLSFSDYQCSVGGAVTVSQLMGDPVLQDIFPGWKAYSRLISSTPIRNMATVAGNLVNASPIGDLSVIFLALDAMVLLSSRDDRERRIPLRGFFTGYKQLAMNKTERITGIRFRLPGKEDHFNFEKVSKRRHLDIASVNTAVLMRIRHNRIESIGLSAGGVAPVPLFLARTCSYLTGKELTVESASAAWRIMQDEIATISDVRGSREYKRLLLRQLFLAHLEKFSPGLVNEAFVSKMNREDEEQ
jgi:xanthine dehydrogenase small subunit